MGVVYKAEETRLHWKQAIRQLRTSTENRDGGRYYLTVARTFTASCGEIRLTYPTAPGVAATYSIRADSESNALGMAPCPVKTTLRHSERNSSGPSPTWFFKKTSCTGPPFKVTGTAWEPSANLVLVPMKMARKSAFVISEVCTPRFATNTTSCALAAEHQATSFPHRSTSETLGELEGETDLGSQHFRIGSQAIWVCIRVVPKRGSVKEMALEFRVKVRVKVITPAHHKVFRVVFRQGRVCCLVDVVAVVASCLKFLAKSITSHCEPGSPVLGKWNHFRPNRDGRIERYPVIFPRQIDFSPAKLAVD